MHKFSKVILHGGFHLFFSKLTRALTFDTLKPARRCAASLQTLKASQTPVFLGYFVFLLIPYRLSQRHVHERLFFWDILFFGCFPG
jgi:hypothetical protein